MATILCVGDCSKETYLVPAVSGEKQKKSMLHSSSSVIVMKLVGGAGRINAMLTGLGHHCPNVPLPPAFHSWYALSDYDGALHVGKFMGIENLPPVEWDKVTENCTLPDSVDVIVLVDHNKGFRDAKSTWQSIFEKYPDTPVILRLHSPFDSPLIEAVTQRSQAAVVVDGRDVRREGGACVSKAISWEDTIEGFCRALDSDHDNALAKLNNSPALIALFGVEGALLQTRNSQAFSRRLLFDTGALENQRVGELPGTMLGLRGAVVCALAEAMASDTTGVDFIDATRKGMTHAIDIATAGFDLTQDKLAWPAKSANNDKTPTIADVPIPEYIPDSPGQWNLLSTSSDQSMQDLAYDVLVNGLEKSLSNVPQIEFGKICLTDRNRIEQFSVVRTLVSDYLNQEKWSQPLSIAVFGSPGSGKSFAVKQILGSIKGFDIKTHTINLSQCSSYDDLLPVFQMVRDDRILGKTPCVFFDEFDSSRGELPWGWLKYFLAPMQDGEYADANSTHPLGGALFFFAGGTAEAFEKFSGLSKDPKRSDLFKASKGPDFISRLHGYLNIAGPNPTSDNDTTWPLRRAIVLRFNLNSSCPTAFDKNNKILRIDENLARALLSAKKYIHGNRSISRLAESMRAIKLERITLSALPAKEILNLHLDGFEVK